MTIEITLDKALKALDAAVAEKGREYVYPDSEKGPDGVTCQYLTADGKASCIVGNAMLRLGVPSDALPQRGDAGVGAEDLLDNLAERGIATHEREVRVLFDVAQTQQDCGVPWGTAAHEGVSAVEEYRLGLGIYV